MSTEVQKYETVLVEYPATHVARVLLNRSRQRNALNTQALYELNLAFNDLAKDDAIKVVILAGVGDHFSAGHDLHNPSSAENMAPYETIGTWCGFGCSGAESRMGIEKEIYLGISERLRNFAKPTIAEVQGWCIAGGLMLIWPCDIIIAAEDAKFMDNTVNMGLAGAEFFNHPWELGVRKAKELLFTSDFWDAREAHRLGMVNHVVTREELTEFTLNLAKRIARQPLLALRCTKEAVNNAQDAAGRTTVMNAQFALHQLGHAHNQQEFGILIDGNSDAAKMSKASLYKK